jgi:1-aminocyclopropane-1-carboxylate synthase
MKMNKKRIKKLLSLSTRGHHLATTPSRIDHALFMEAKQNLYDPEDNPSGSFPLNVAENQIMAPIIMAKLMTVLKNKEMPDWVMGYTHYLGHPEVRVTIARFMEQHLCACKIHPDTLGLSAGATAIVEVTAFLLANPGDVVVIPAPAYPMYTNDFGIKAGISRYDLQTHDNLQEIGTKAPVTPDLLERTWATLKTEGRCFKILLISSPDNPTGCRYEEDQLRALARWCIEHQVHMIVNEIYGLSLIDTTPTDHPSSAQGQDEYVSFAKIMEEFVSDYLHLWYAFSKDFGMSGLRCGVVYSLNKGFISGLQNINVPHMVSNMSQWMIKEMLSDDEFIKNYIEQNKKQITRSYQWVVAALKLLDVPFIPSRGGIFVWIDLSSYLDANKDDAEIALWMNIYKQTGVLLTPGKEFKHLQKGLFRMVYTAVSFDHLKVAVERLSAYLGQFKIR